jgi:hypothetical protein
MNLSHLTKLRLALLVWMIALFPFAMSSKRITIALYVLFLLSVFWFAVKPSPKSGRLFIAILIAFHLTFILPIEVNIARGITFQTSWNRVNPDDQIRELDTTFGVKPRWVLQIDIPL